MSAKDWSTGPVAITGADGHVGRALQRRLAQLPNRIRPLGRDYDWAPVMDDNEAVIHLAGTIQPKRPDTCRSANLETVKRLLDAMSSSPVQGIVFLSYVGADPDSDNYGPRAMPRR